MVDVASNIQHGLEDIFTGVANATSDSGAQAPPYNDAFNLPEPACLAQSGAIAQLLARAPGACVKVPDQQAVQCEPQRGVAWRLSIDALLERLKPDSFVEPDETVPRGHRPGELGEVQGMFFGCHLLYPGWWSRPSGGPLLRPDFWGAGAGVQKVVNIRRWLNNGFEQWGPSWNISDPIETKPMNFEDLLMFGQIGHNDEANSLPVVIGAEKTAQLRADLGDRLAIEASVTGRLYHYDDDTQHLNPAMQRGLKRMFDAGSYSPYYLLVDDKDDECRVRPVPKDKREVEIYSAYLWQCLVRAEDEQVAREGVVPIDNTLFTWEHTNLLDPDTVRFNFESLWFKKKCLENRLGVRLLVLQHSYAVDQFIRESKRVIEPLVESSVLSEVLARARASTGPG